MKPKFVKKFLRVQGGNIFSAVTSLQIQVRLGGIVQSPLHYIRLPDLSFWYMRFLVLLL
jgi:hypothetical protein